MRALPQIDIQPPAASTTPDSSTARSAGRGQSEGFAQALQRTSEKREARAADAEEKPLPGKDEPQVAEAPPSKPADPGAKGETPAEPAVPTTAVAAVETPVISPLIPQPIAAILPAVAAESAAQEIAPAAAAAAAPSVATAPLAIAANVPLAAPMTVAEFMPILETAIPSPLPAASTKAPIVAGSAPAQVPTAAPAPVVPTAIAPLAAWSQDGIAPLADLATLAAALAPRTTPAPAATGPATVVPGTDPAHLLQPGSEALELDPTAALPPVTAPQGGVPLAEVPMRAIPLAMAPEPVKPEAAATPTPALAALPASQPSAMHVVAAALGDHAPAEAPVDGGTTTVKPAGESIALVPQQPLAAAPAVPQRPMTEAVLAQDALAANGNAMEKAVSHQVSRALMQQLPNGDRMLVLRLTPPELGTVRIEVVERQGSFTARLQAEDDGVRLAIERFLPAMRQELRASDAPIRELTLSDHAQFHRSFDGQGQQRQQSERSDRREREDAPRFSLDGVATEVPGVRRGAPLGGRVGLSGVDALA
jgi:hypothetical protein